MTLEQHPKKGQTLSNDMKPVIKIEVECIKLGKTVECELLEVTERWFTLLCPSDKGAQVVKFYSNGTQWETVGGVFYKAIMK